MGIAEQQEGPAPPSGCNTTTQPCAAIIGENHISGATLYPIVVRSNSTYATKSMVLQGGTTGGAANAPA